MTSYRVRYRAWEHDRWVDQVSAPLPREQAMSLAHGLRNAAHRAYDNVKLTREPDEAPLPHSTHPRHPPRQRQPDS